MPLCGRDVESLYDMEDVLIGYYLTLLFLKPYCLFALLVGLAALSSAVGVTSPGAVSVSSVAFKSLSTSVSSSGLDLLVPLVALIPSLSFALSP